MCSTPILIPFLKQAWVVSSVVLNIMAVGMAVAYPSVLLPTLLAPNSSIQLDLHTASWISSCVAIANIPGFWMSSITMTYWSRKIAHLIAIIPAILGWIAIYFSTNVTTLLCGRILTGFSSGASFAVGAVVIGEYTSAQNRGMFFNLKATAFSLGGFVIHLLSNYLSWRMVAIIITIIEIVALVINITWPESPAWLASRQEFDRCKKAFVWLRGSDEAALIELKELIKSQSQKRTEPKRNTIYAQAMDLSKKFGRKDFYKPMFIICSGFLLLEASGRHVFPAYGLMIVGEITENKTQTFYYTLVVDIVIILGSLLSVLLVKTMKRRTLLFGTGGAALVLLTTLCIYLFLISKGVTSKDKPWIPICLLIVYFSLTTFGCIPLPMCFLGEVMPLAHREVGTALASTSLSMFVYAVLKVTPFLLAEIKVYGTLAVFCVVILLCLIILYFILPETKDRTLQEIENFINCGKYTLSEDRECDNEEKLQMIDEEQAINKQSGKTNDSQ